MLPGSEFRLPQAHFSMEDIFAPELILIQESLHFSQRLLMPRLRFLHSVVPLFGASLLDYELFLTGFLFGSG